MHARIHNFFPAQDGSIYLDEEGDERHGFYYEIIEDEDTVGQLVGPYHSAADAERACEASFARADY